MVGGFNHNFRYKDQVFHVQTEDSGNKKSEITTLLYSGGTILARNTTSYADLVRDKLHAEYVELRMKDQHKQMLRELKDGHYDDRISELLAAEEQPEKQPEKQPESVKKKKAKTVAKKPMALDDLIVAYLTAGR